MITLENHLTIEDWRFRVNFTESDIRRFAEGMMPEWFVQDCLFWTRTNPKPSDVPPRDEAEAERKTA